MLFGSELMVIKSQLSATNLFYWKLFGAILGGTSLFLLLAAVFMEGRRWQLPLWMGALLLFFHIGFLYVFDFYRAEIIPSTIPLWMLSSDASLYPGTFLMPAMVYGLLILIEHSLKGEVGGKPWRNFSVAVAAPVCLYLFVVLILPLAKPLDHHYEQHLMVVVTLSALLLFLFFLLRGIYQIIIRRERFESDASIILKLVLSLVFPLTGLLLNNGALFNGFVLEERGIFGNFSDAGFYELTLLNAIVICMPANYGAAWFRLLLFAGRSFTFAYSLYFCLVFLPFLPLSILATLFFGAGLLMLTPLALFLLHIQLLVRDFAYLRPLFGSFCTLSAGYRQLYGNAPVGEPSLSEE
jgi:hypothetical protein